jgi:CubicO group peptidase (beta-lactamase class C family)
MTGGSMKPERTILFFIIIYFALSCTFQAASAQSNSEKIDNLVKLYSEYRQFNGSILVAEAGKVILKKGYGFANMEWGIPNRPDTKFRLGSVTKQFTSMIIMQLVQQGKIKLDGTITDYLPEYPKRTGNKITIHHLLTHTSGIPGYTEFANFTAEMERNAYSPDAFVKMFADSALLFEPGTQWSYSNSGYFLLGAIIERVTGKTYEQVLSENILKPVGMENTGYDHSQTIIARRAAGYEKRGRNYINTDYLDMSVPYSAGSLYSTVEDLYLWDQALYTDKLISAENKAKMFTPFLNSYAYGWGITRTPIGNTTESVATIQHGGGINGFNTLVCRVPGEKHLIVLLNNTGGAPLGPMMRSILAILYGKSYSPPKKSVADALFAAMQEKGIAAGIELYRDMREKHADEFSLVESEMNIIGYEFLNQRKYDEAVAVLKFNIEEFPKSSNAYDSLGEAYMMKGDQALAIKNYEKSLELNPRNANASDKLKVLRGK